MVDVSHELPEETDARLERVIRSATLKVYDGLFAYQQFPLSNFPVGANPDAIAFVRDDEVWSQLVPYDGKSGERFSLFKFHFEPGLDNSGFVGWLATRFKRRFGTGVFVVCGLNSAQGGIFDYWGCPADLADLVIADVQQLVHGVSDVA